MFINFSNHPSERWDKGQNSEACRFGEIVDIAFPVVNPAATSAEVANLADEWSQKIVGMRPDAVLCQGEFSLTFALTNRLIENGIKVVTACSERNVINETMPDGTIRKITLFRFVGFRDYL
jgi:hypothetical protein